MLNNNHRTTETDKKFDADAADARFTNLLFLQLIAKDKSFTRQASRG
jgi:hypothetical protein